MSQIHQCAQVRLSPGRAPVLKVMVGAMRVMSPHSAKPGAGVCQGRGRRQAGTPRPGDTARGGAGRAVEGNSKAIATAASPTPIEPRYIQA